MKTLITQPHNHLRRLGARWLTAMVTLCCLFAVKPAAAQNWILGTGTSMFSQTSSIPSPLGFYYGLGRMQYMWKASELTAAGIPANTVLHQFSFKVGALQNAQGANNSAAPNAEIRIQTTNLATLNSANFVNTGWIYTLSGPFEPALGWNTFNLPAPGLFWNGTDNIIIDIGYYTGFNSSYPTGNGNAGVYYTSAPSSGGPYGIYAYSYNGTNNPWTLPPTGISTTTQRPNIRFTSMTPCLGIARKGSLNYPASVTGICPGTRLMLADTNYGTNINIDFAWQSGPSATGPFTNIPGATSDKFLTPPLTSNVYYRLFQTCTITNDKDSTAPVGLSVSAPVTWAPLPYFEGFESWVNGCGTSDKPSASWTNIPFTGNSSRRRNDQGSTASWTSPNTGVKAKEGQYSSRYHYYQNSPTTTGNEFSLHLDCSATTGTKELQFWYMFRYSTALGSYDSLTVEFSTNGGRTFSLMSPTSAMDNYSSVPGQWKYQTYPLPSNSPNTIVRFRSRLKNYGTDHDIYIDAVRVVPPCDTKPVAGKIDSVLACDGQNVTLMTTGTSQAAGLTYLWQSRPSGTTLPWSAMPGGTDPTVTTVVTKTPQDVRVIVSCGNLTPALSDTTAVYVVKPAPFYYCYCNNIQASSTVTNNYFELGNTTLVKESNKDTLINNGIAIPTVGNTNATKVPYEDYRTIVPVADLVLDSTYRLWLTQTASYTSFWTSVFGGAWIDYNQNGIFDTWEKIMLDKTIVSSSNPTANQVFKVPDSSKVGITGLRVALSYSTTPLLPCHTNNSTYGQFEDYLVRINYQPCTGPASPGTTFQSDTSVCPGYTVDLWNTTYQTDRTGIARAWELSTNNGASYAAIPNSADKDSMINLVVSQATSSKYRLRLICTHTNDTTYSNVVTVTTPVPYRCYPTSWASYGPQDSSDIGTVILADRFGHNLLTSPATGAGPHLLNPLAVKRRTDYTLIPPVELHADSVYRLAVFHTMPRDRHADAMVSVFFDYNNDGDYDVTVTGLPYTTERALQGISVIDSFFLDTWIKIPSAVIPNVPTGMRVVINNDLNPNAPGNSGIGAFTSGEVEDYVVIFRRTNVGVAGSTLLNNLGLYPNPTDGKFTVRNVAARPVSHMDIVVTTVSGQEVIRRSYDNVGTQFNTNLDLSTQAKGIYFVEIRADGEKVTKKLVVR